ncbi:MAG: class I SAM-dependent methyltransferase [Planctomycetota bacterium]|jgi:SAM-dependent methyltransferase
MSEAGLNLSNRVCLDVFDEPRRNCPACNSKGLSVFYSLNDIPVHSCLLIPSKQEALKVARGDLQLGFCRRCGFVSNSLFDPISQQFSAQYEETQGFSDCFNTFAKSLAQRLIDKYDIHKKTILEIGCGKGQFLTLMCQLGRNRGIGIDPAYVPGRNPESAEVDIDFIQDYYSEEYANLEADVICCRHTLEHISDPRQLIRKLRLAIGNRRDTLVFFELPGFMRVLNEGAFWDIYYEHCNYFTAGSLARLFRSCGFAIDDLYLDYDGQYLIVVAWPAPGPTVMSLDIENDLELLPGAIEKFRKKCSGSISHWHSSLKQMFAFGQKVVLWGSGSKAAAFLATVSLAEKIDYVVDINPFKHGKYMPGTGQEIVSPQFLNQYKPNKVVVMNPVYRDEVRRDLDCIGVKADLAIL